MKNTNVKSAMGTIIREMRNKAKLSQERLAEAIYTKKTTIYRHMKMTE